MEALAELTTREAVPVENTWDLEGLYASGEHWQADFQSLESRRADYASFQGTLAESAEKLKACLQFDMEFSRKLEKVYTYAHLRNDEDKTNSLHQGNYEKATRLLTQYQQARSFINAEIMAIPETTMEGFMQDPALELYRLYLERQLRFRRHTLSENEEALLAGSAEIARTASNAFGMLDNADLKLGTVKDEHGRETAITHGNLQSLLQKYDRRVRQETFETFYRAYENHKFTYSTLLASSVKKDIFYARARRYPSVREMALFAENIPAPVYDNLITTVHHRLEPLYKYFDIRKRILNLEALHVYDCSVPLVQDLEWRMPYDEAVQKIGEALEPLGTEYVQIMKTGLLEDRWTDRYENKGKRSGAYSSGCYDSNPFILMNYLDDNINSVYTLAHEAGHSMHSHFSNKNQPYLYADYTIFVAEVASTFNEALLTRYFLSQDISRDMRIYLICREIDNFRGTLFRQTMFAEFEHQMYAAAESDQPMTADRFQDLYMKLLERYFGDNVILDDCLSLECFRIPHFYFGFYVYKYATGISAAYALADRVCNGGPAELNDYLRFLKSGGSQYPIDLLKGAGVDMSSPLPIETALKKFAELVDELESLTA
ncbi:MAG: oligoendopeptidase F [Nitrospinaceae bacterium]|nr:oligoendopeptidase F [Nitrospinaceae bacterium]NIR57360.1 oligoendopeptidase F [Nitrospinaceae bacterium]NIS87812.1 oligoendopeptidase F [Nitrospinaceae bacterium]NIT84682.1 oligoendopeptidase F [Nitrospinaceae bacterium]NIU46861.1 oligoendopeptidase F [Nitrospinaceae bacterium]